MIPEDKVNEFVSHHQDWLRQPITKTFIAILEQYEKELAARIAEHSCQDLVSDRALRNEAVQLKQTQTIKQLIYASNSFCARAAKVHSTSSK